MKLNISFLSYEKRYECMINTLNTKRPFLCNIKSNYLTYRMSLYIKASVKDLRHSYMFRYIGL